MDATLLPSRRRRPFPVPYRYSRVAVSFLRTSESEDARVQVSDDPRVGTELAGYRIESLLGSGGMSVVHLAEDLRLKRRVALKLLAASLAEDESFRDRFLRGSELAASIDHPNIIPIYEAGEAEDGLLFIALRLVDGFDLRRLLVREGTRRLTAPGSMLWVGPLPGSRVQRFGRRIDPFRVSTISPRPS